MSNYNLLKHVTKGKQTLQSEFKDVPSLPDPRNPYLSDADRCMHEEWNRRDINYNKAQDIAISGRNQSLKLAVYPALQPKYIKQTQSPSFSFDLVGFGEVRDNCGMIRHSISCTENSKQTTLTGEDYSHDNFLMMHSCHRAECPIDYMSWAYREGRQVEEKIHKANLSYLDIGVRLGYANHIILSPPQKKAGALIGSNKSSDYKILRNYAYEASQLLGIKGGVLIFHPFRIIAGVADLLKSEGYGVGGVDSKGSLWFGVHNNVLKSPNGWKDYVYESPHFHIIGVGRLMRPDKFHLRSGGWVYKNKGVRDSESSLDKSCFGSDLSDVGRTVIYALSHSGLSNNFKVQSVTWFGAFSNGKVIVANSYKIKQTVPCSKCERELHHFDLTYDMDECGKEIVVPDFNHDLGVHQITILKKYFVLSESAVSKCTSCRAPNVIIPKVDGGFPLLFKKPRRTSKFYRLNLSNPDVIFANWFVSGDVQKEFELRGFSLFSGW